MKETIRLATKEDSESILDIYSKYIIQTSITFEVVVPTIKDFEKRIENIIVSYPYLVYEVGDTIVGYAYASKHRERAAYCYDVDVSVYFSEAYHNKGKAKILYSCLFEILKEQGYYNAYAAYTEPNNKSKRFHEKFNFKAVGIYHKTGYKFGQWHDVTWLEKEIQPHDANPVPIKTMSEVSKDFINNLFARYNT